MENELKSIAQGLRAARYRLLGLHREEYTQEAVAARAGVDRTTVSRCENSASGVTTDVLGRVARAVGMRLALEPLDDVEGEEVTDVA